MLRQLLPPPRSAGRRLGQLKPVGVPISRLELRYRRSSARFPDMKSAEDFDKSANGLAQLRVESWAGFVFTTFNEMAPHLIDTLGDLPERLASHQLDEMRCTWTITLEPRCNWKLDLGEAMETYHTGLVPSPERRSAAVAHADHPWRVEVYPGHFRPVHRHPARHRAAVPDHRRARRRQRNRAPTSRCSTRRFSSQLPKTACGGSTSHRSPTITRCWRSVAAFPADVVVAADFERNAAPYYERWELVGREDTGILERQQKALGSVAYRPGRLSWRDDRCRPLAGGCSIGCPGLTPLPHRIHTEHNARCETPCAFRQRRRGTG